MRFNLSILFFLFFFHQTIGQSLFQPLERQYLLSEEASINAKSSDLHTSIQPFITKETKNLYNLDSLREGVHYPIQRKTFLGRTADNLLSNYIVKIDSGIVSIRVSPLFDFSGSYDPIKKASYFTNTRGFLVNATFGKNVSFATGYYENQSTFPAYINTFANTYGVVPGQGITKPFKANGQDYSIPFGYIAYSPSKYLTVQFGQDKNFIGNGYRSLLLSDNATNAPFLKLMSSFWHLKYMVLINSFNNITNTSQQSPLNGINGVGYPQKFNAIHYLDWQVNKSLNIGLFESVTWIGHDSVSNRGFDWAYANPVIFLKESNANQGNPDNSIIGMNVKYKWTNTFYTYGQLMIDDIKISEMEKKNSAYPQKYGIQLGGRWFNIAKIKGLAIQGEFDYVMPYSYTNYVSFQNYTNMGQSLADPQNANFKEFIGIIDYNRKRWSISNRTVYYLYGADDSPKTNYGHNIFADKSVYGATGYYMSRPTKILQGDLTTVLYDLMTVAYIINPRLNMRIEASYTYRTLNNNVSHDSNHIFGLSFKTALFNKYYDF